MATKDYAAIARSRIVRPADNKRPPRILVYGRNKKGKTRFCTSAPDVLILDPEDGTVEEKKRNPNVWPVDTWDDINDAYHYLRLGKHPYKWVSIDGVTRISNIALRLSQGQKGEVNLDAMPKGARIQHYGAAGELVKGMLHNFHSLRNMGVILTAQERMVTVEELDEMDDDDATVTTFQFVPDVPKGARSALNAIVDLTGRIYVVNGEFSKKVRTADGKVVVHTSTRQRRLWVGVDDKYETGYRSDFVLPDFIEEPTVAKVIKAMREGASK